MIGILPSLLFTHRQFANRGRIRACTILKAPMVKLSNKGGCVHLAPSPSSQVPKSVFGRFLRKGGRERKACCNPIQFKPGTITSLTFACLLVCLSIRCNRASRGRHRAFIFAAHSVSFLSFARLYRPFIQCLYVQFGGGGVIVVLAIVK